MVCLNRTIERMPLRIADGQASMMRRLESFWLHDSLFHLEMLDDQENHCSIKPVWISDKENLSLQKCSRNYQYVP